jgi:hypothetical protein
MKRVINGTRTAGVVAAAALRKADHGAEAPRDWLFLRYLRQRHAY